MWKDHMLQHHRNWSQYIHWQLMWRCNLECEDWPENPIVRPKDPMHQSEVLFSTPGHLCGHVRALHGDIWDGLNDNSATDFIEKSTIDVPRKPNICPLCYFIPKGMESLDDHSDETAPVPTAMVNHIVEHLQNLMILSIRLIGIQNEEVDCDSEGGSMVPMESPQGSQLDHSEEHSNLSELSSPPIGSPPFRMETFALGYDQPPEADDQAWSTIVEETRRQKPESDIYTDPILDALRNHPQMQNLHYVTEESHVLERPETPPSPLSTVPFPRNTNFVGRKSLLDQIHEKCSPAASFIALVGPGGVGKSQLAIEYSCQIREQSPETWVFWISAFSAISIEKSYREIADRVKITGRNDPRTDILTLVYRWLSNQERKWILILDGTNNIDYLSVFFNVLSESAFKRDPPRHSNSSIIMTTQSKDIALSVITQADLIEVGPMDEKDALTLVNGALGIQENREDAIELIKALDFIPLAIVQAAAHLRRKGPHFSISELLETLRGSNDANKLKIFEYKKEDYPWGWGVHESIMRTWQRSFENMQEIRPSAAEILSYMSFFDPHNIPRALVRRRSEICAEDFLGVSRIPKLEKWFTYGLQMLFDLSFISSDSSVGDFNMSRLVQLAMQEWLKADRSFDAWHSAYITDLNAAFPTPDDINWKQCRLLYPHVKSVMTHDPSEVSCHEWDSLLYKGASYALREKILVDVRAYVSRASDLRAKVSINRAPPRVYKASFELVWARNDQWNTLGEHLAKAILDENVNQSVNKDSVLKLFFTGKNKYTNEVAQKFADAENARSTSLGPKGFPKLFKVSLYQQVIYCDDSSSMKLEDRWNSQKELVKQVTKITTRFLPKDEGVALRFINQDIDNSVNLSLERVENILESMLWDPRGDSQIGTHLKSKILQPLVYRKLESRCLGRPLLVSVFTDGIPSNEQESTFTDAILECGDMLENAGYRRGSVRFMVGQIGTENSARMFLENMRHNVAIAKVVFCISDPLDTVLREYDKNEEDLDGWLSETLFSSIWDGKDEDEDYQLIPTWPW
ncbi:hypothetical protein FQN49_005572 [Arthroderma sp. PD_2]|nr:hypothetical protein FQN49_005572 [Arthroderma sp. PD_2]